MLMLSYAKLSIDKGPHTFCGDQGEFQAQSPIVIAIAVADIGSITFKDYVPVGEVAERSLSLPSEMAHRLGQFFMKNYGDNEISLSERNADCHSFVSYMLGGMNHAIRVPDDGTTHAQLEQVPTAVSAMQPFLPYQLVTWDRFGLTGTGVHSVLALGNSENISVRGIGSPIVIANTHDMLGEFNAQTVHRITTLPIYPA